MDVRGERGAGLLSHITKEVQLALSPPISVSLSLFVSLCDFTPFLHANFSNLVLPLLLVYWQSNFKGAIIHLLNEQAGDMLVNAYMPELKKKKYN